MRGRYRESEVWRLYVKQGGGWGFEFNAWMGACQRKGSMGRKRGDRVQPVGKKKEAERDERKRENRTRCVDY